MNYNQALMVVRNLESGYTPEKIMQAALFILSRLYINNDEDMSDASFAIIYARDRIAKAAAAQGGAE